MSDLNRNLDSSLDTLAYSGTHSKDNIKYEPIYKLVGQGTSMASMLKRPSKKFFDQKLMGALMDVAKENNDWDMHKRYKNTWYCFTYMKTDGERAFGKYCKNRWCTVCSANRKGRLIKQYLPIIEKMGYTIFSYFDSQNSQAI